MDYGLVEARISASEKLLPVWISFFDELYLSTRQQISSSWTMQPQKLLGWHILVNEWSDLVDTYAGISDVNFCNSSKCW